MYKVVMKSWGGTKEDFVTELTLEEAEEICELNNWQFDTGYIWDLDIEEED